MASQPRIRLAVCGHVRDILNKDQDYRFIISIIVEYIHQGFSKYFEEKSNKEYLKEMRCGDIVTCDDGQIMVMGKDNVLLNVGDFYEEEIGEDEWAVLTLPFLYRFVVN